MGLALLAGAFADFAAFGAAWAFLEAALAFFGAAFAAMVLRVRIQILQSNAAPVARSWTCRKSRQ
jgi:hypothetical protein